MINFETITHEHCLFFLGAVAGEEGPLLNILKTTYTSIIEHIDDID